MAQRMTCDGCEERPADLLISNVGNGEQLALCVPCSVPWAEGHAAGMRKLMGWPAADQEVGAATEPTEPAGAESGQQGTERTGFDEGGESNAELPGAHPGPEGAPEGGAGSSGANDPGEDREGGPGRGGQGGRADGAAPREGHELTESPAGS